MSMPNIGTASVATAPMTSTPATAEPTQAEKTYNTMSIANILTEPTAILTKTTIVPKDITPSPSTPKQSVALEEENVDSPDTVMSDAEPESVEGCVEDTEEAEDIEDIEDAEDVPDADREFLCMNDPCGRCQTGQYTKELSRKTISDHFGRNKSCTRQITDWPLYCRKHYQRATYNKAKWQVRKIALILRQLDIIETQYPGTTYGVHFKKAEEGRLNHYSRQVASGVSNQDAEKNVAPVAGKHFEAPIDVLRELDQYTGNGKPIADVKKVIDVIAQMLEAKETEQVPSIEFLPQVPSKSPKKKTPAKARTPKTPKTSKDSKVPATPKTPSRVSAKGSVKRPSQ